MGIRETKKIIQSCLKWDGKPSAGQVFPPAAQHVLAAVVGCDAGNFGCKCGE